MKHQEVYEKIMKMKENINYLKKLGQPMRDPNRIPPILNELAILWRKNPDLRLGQLIVIAATMFKKEVNIFVIEDDNLLRGLKEMQKEQSSPPPKGLNKNFAATLKDILAEEKKSDKKI